MKSKNPSENKGIGGKGKESDHQKKSRLIILGKALAIGAGIAVEEGIRRRKKHPAAFRK